MTDDSDNIRVVNDLKRQFLYAIVDKVQDTTALDRIFLAVNQILYERKEESERRL